MKKRLELAELKKTLETRHKMSSDSKLICKMVMVDGIRASDVADTMGVSRQQVYALTKNIYARYLSEIAKKPRDWIVKSYCLPVELIERVDKIESDALKKEAKKNGK